MKSVLVISMSLFALNTLAWTVETETKCGAPDGRSDFSASTDGIVKRINSLHVKMDQSGTPKVEMNVSGVTAVDAANNDNSIKSFNEIFSVKEMKSGTLFELKGADQNTFNLDAVFLEFGNVDVITAGPVPEGTYNQVLSLAVIDSNIFYKNPSPMTVKKFVFNCKTSIKYHD